MSESTVASPPRLSIVEKLGYGLGDCGANFVFQTQLIFLMSFYTDVVGLASATVGTMFLVSRLWDAVNDPLIGALADRTSTRWGKFRPWVLLTALPFAFCFVLAYTVPDLEGQAKIVWAYITYNLLMMAYTANNIPYAALTGVITPDPVERTALTSWRFLMAMSTAFVVQTFTPQLVETLGDGDDALGYRLTMTLWAALATVFFVITFATTRERVAPAKTQPSSVAKDLKGLLKSRTWIALAAATVCYFLYLSMRGSVGIYYFQYVLGPDLWLGRSWVELFAWYSGAGLLASMAGILLAKPLSLRFGKRDVLIGSVLGSSGLTAAFYVLPDSLPWAAVGTQCLLQFVYGVSIPLLWAMMADVADYHELRSGDRATAMTFAATVFALKLGLSLGGALTGWLLDRYGYVPNVAQSASAMEGIRLMMSLLPAGAFVASGLALFAYQIDLSTEQTLGERLEALRKPDQTTA